MAGWREGSGVSITCAFPHSVVRLRMNWLRRAFAAPVNDPAHAVSEALARLGPIEGAIKSLLTHYAALDRRLEALERAEATRSADTLDALHRLDTLHRRLMGRVHRLKQLGDGGDEDTGSAASESTFAARRRLGR